MALVCLLCARNQVGGVRCWEEEEEEVVWVEETDEIFGGELENLFREDNKKAELVNFVLVNILGIGDNELVTGMMICEDCIATGVRKLWELYWAIKKLETELSGVKEEIKDSMRERVERRLKRKRGQGGRGDKTDKALQKIVREAFSTHKTAFQDIQEANGESIESSADVNHDVDSDREFAPEMDDNDETFQPLADDLASSYSDDSDSNNASDAELSPAKKFKSSSSGSRSRRNHTGKRCDRCHSYHRDQEAYQAHMDLHSENDAKGDLALNCAQCQFPCRTQKELDLHIHNRHVIPNRALVKKCGLCPFSTKVWKYLQRHAKSEHPDATPEELGHDYRLQCSVCNFKARTPRAYGSHVLECGRSPPSHAATVPCPECGVLFQSDQKLQDHIMIVHKRESQFCCDICGRGFAKRLHLQRHMTTHNPEKRDFVCHLCGMDYAYQFTLSEHYRRFHPEGAPMPENSSNEVYQCRYCPLTSPFSLVIKRHLKTHKEESGNKCELCGKCYVNPNGLRRHMQINHSENQEVFPCEYCNREYANKVALQCHQYKHCAIKKMMQQTQG